MWNKKVLIGIAVALFIGGLFAGYQIGKNKLPVGGGSYSDWNIERVISLQSDYLERERGLIAEDRASITRREESLRGREKAFTEERDRFSRERGVIRTDSDAIKRLTDIVTEIRKISLVE